MEYSALVLLNPIRVRVMKMIEYISELEALIASSSEVNWVDVLAKYNIYSLEISQLESFLAQKNIRSFLASMLIEPRILPQERPDERWFVPNVLLRSRPIPQLEDDLWRDVLSAESSNLLFSMEDFFDLDPPRLSALISEYTEKIKSHDTHFINLINQIGQEPTGAVKHQRSQSDSSSQGSSSINLATMIKYQYEL